MRSVRFGLKAGLRWRSPHRLVSMPHVIVAGDVGGTKTDLALFEPGGSPRAPVRERRALSREHPSFDRLLLDFVRSEGINPTRVVLGIAGPIVDNRCETTNLPWSIDGNALGLTLDAPVTLINDLEATGWGVSVLGPSDLRTLQRGVPAAGNRALIAAGTGLGEGILVPQGGAWRPIPSEGGHVDFAPSDPLEDEILVRLRSRFDHVSYERILSGPGLVDLYAFFSETGRGEEPREIAERIASAPDPAPIITETGTDGTCGRARLALEKFVEIYGAEAGNLALKVLAIGGVYVGGGIAPRILPFLEDGRFLAAFTRKGRLTPVLEQIPVHVILDPRTALWGAAVYALEQSGKRAGAPAPRG